MTSATIRQARGARRGEGYEMIVFAAALLVTVGIFNLIDGIAAIAHLGPATRIRVSLAGQRAVREYLPPRTVMVQPDRQASGARQVRRTGPLRGAAVPPLSLNGKPALRPG
jgi:hypothetical protein